MSVVETCYFDSKFLKRPNAENFNAELNAALHELPTKNMLQQSMDGPNTNWKVLDLLNKQQSNMKVPPLLDIASCGLHVIHGAFRTGVESTSSDLKKILKGMWQIFHDSPEETFTYEKIIVCEEFPLTY